MQEGEKYLKNLGKDQRMYGESSKKDRINGDGMKDMLSERMAKKKAAGGNGARGDRMRGKGE